MAELVTPDVRYRESFLAAMEEFAAEGRAGDGSMVGNDLATYSSTWHSADGFAAYVEALVAERHTPRFAHYVCSTSLWWVDAAAWLGRIAIRHELSTPFLRELGGHIGYDVRRSARRRGHATAMLAAALPVAHDLGIDPALVTCDTDNEASRRTIVSNGGELEDQRGGKLRFWVPTS
ncbi:hypothetical protein GCM10011519_08580 [Marmoricola endophyticus]|uniref:N-acetyltransferase domain-containing protein n=1 Tax=Marmoricola endophyticus TaxID=2040280 RepID=A0A917EZL9_9ACTN|nr:GNAT family N-acetyltransferase [Marmoricola endophyticus]GGF37342.1 hypothetical protein GCM10011519_08580 [Marmoricola endophyticus]